MTNQTIQQSADAYASQHCLARDGGLTAYGCELIAYGRHLDALVLRGERLAIIQELRSTNTGAEFDLARTAYQLVQDATLMAAERRAAAAYARLEVTL